MDMLIHDFSRFNLGVGHCACCSVSLLFVGSANWMAARNVALPIDIGLCPYTPVENILFTLPCTLHQPNSIDQCLFLAVVNFILAATQVRYF